MSTRFGKVLENLGKLPPSAEQPEKPRPRRSAPSAPATAPRKVGRPPGKKSDPDYSQVTVYLRKANHLAAKKRLIDDGKEFSELVDDLVSTWLQNSGSKSGRLCRSFCI